MEKITGNIGLFIYKGIKIQFKFLNGWVVPFKTN